MSNLEEIEKLHEMKEKGIISEIEFEEQKAKLLQQTSGGKSQLAYCLLAFFLGTFGVHNFYVGRWKRGLAQLLITLLTLFIGALFITNIWAVINIFTIHTDAKGNEFEPCKPAKYICGILGIVGYAWALISVFVVGVAGIAGYHVAMANYKVDQLIDYSSKVSASAHSQQITSSVPCESIYTEMRLPSATDCVVYPDGKIILSGVVEDVKRDLIEKGKMQEDSSGNLIFSR